MRPIAPDRVVRCPRSTTDPNRRGRGSLQHVAFQCETFDDLLGTYARLKGLGILPQWAADHGLGTAISYADPDGNIVEINVNNYGNAWTATEHMKTVPTTMMQVDPDKMIAARKAGASAWALHEPTRAGPQRSPHRYGAAASSGRLIQPPRRTQARRGNE